MSNSFALFNTPIDYIYLSSAIICVFCAALAAGMTMGLLSLDHLKLRIKCSVGTAEEKKSVRFEENQFHFTFL